MPRKNDVEIAEKQLISAESQGVDEGILDRGHGEETLQPAIGT